ncbi:hypothetical protein [Pseudoalteromonas sp. McH1-42]|uniref:hypothetical protein n=1 Tax=Pseudoalteromonas sp. McH1-42 TaxID=2917752 RepID=UPI001EF5E711|nr:hypothetical protein [Pseudoalteromonas sp. McH1-42]MCG7564559.1 hypothetical protein [Pseudoalteromonas sp. McH1-42]
MIIIKLTEDIKMEPYASKIALAFIGTAAKETGYFFVECFKTHRLFKYDFSQRKFCVMQDVADKKLNKEQQKKLFQLIKEVNSVCATIFNSKFESEAKAANNWDDAKTILEKLKVGGGFRSNKLNFENASKELYDLVEKASSEDIPEEPHALKPRESLIINDIKKHLDSTYDDMLNDSIVFDK